MSLSIASQHRIGKAVEAAMRARSAWRMTVALECIDKDTNCTFWETFAETAAKMTDDTVESFCKELEFMIATMRDTFTCNVPYGPLAGQMVSVSVHAYSAEVGAYVVSHGPDNFFLMAPQYLHPEPPRDVLNSTNCPSFRFPVGEMAKRRYDSYVEDVNGQSLDGEVVDVQIVHHLPLTRKKLYVVFAPSDHDSTNPDDWYCAYDVRAEEDLF